MKKKPVLLEKLNDSLITAGILSVASIICMILRRFSSTDTHVPREMHTGHSIYNEYDMRELLLQTHI